MRVSNSATVERCLCASKSNEQSSVESNEPRKPLRLANNAGSPSQLAMVDGMRHVLSQSLAEDYCIYLNPNDDTGADTTALELKQAIANRENVDKESIIFWSGGYSALNIILAALKPLSSLIILGDFLGYKNTARHGHKVYEAHANTRSMITNARNLQPEIVLFTDGETNPSLAPVDSFELVNEIRLVSPHSLILIDQAYGRSAGDCLRVNKLAIEDENIIFLRCASKDTGAVGIRLAWTITKPGGRADKLLRDLPTPYEVSMDVAKKAINLYQSPEIMDAVAQYQAAARQLITQKLRSRGIHVRSGTSPWVLFKPKMNAAEAVNLLKDNDIHVQLQTGLHSELEGYIRVSTTICSEMNIFYEEAMRLGVI